MSDISVRRSICFASIVEGDVVSPERASCERALFTRLCSLHARISMVTLHGGGCAFAVADGDVATVRQAIGSLNVALSVRRACALVAMTGIASDRLPAIVGDVLTAMADEGIGLIHLCAGADDLCVLLDERDAERARRAIVAACERSALAAV